MIQFININVLSFLEYTQSQVNNCSIYEIILLPNFQIDQFKYTCTCISILKYSQFQVKNKMHYLISYSLPKAIPEICQFCLIIILLNVSILSCR